MKNVSKAAKLIEIGNEGDPRGISVVPKPDVLKMMAVDTTSIDLRLGRWFLTLRQSRTEILDPLVQREEEGSESRTTKRYFVPFAERFILHPGRFALGATLEWIRLPTGISGYVTGKSSWGRRGLIIETAAGVHPGFSGCLTLELANVGEIPIALRPGMPVCQIFLHDTEDALDTAKLPSSRFSGKRRPTLGRIHPDPLYVRLNRRNC